MAIRRKRNKKDGKVMSIWFSADILRRLDILAETFRESRSSLLNDLLEERLSYYEEMITAAQEAKDELQENE